MFRELGRKSGGFGYLMSSRGRTGPLWRSGTPFGLKTRLQLRVYKPSSVGTSLNQDSKWKFQIKKFD